MTAATRPIPEGYHSVTPYLIIKDAGQAIDFYKRAFGATEQFRMDGPDGRVMHAEIQIGDSKVMLADEYPERGYRGPDPDRSSPVTLMFYVEDVDTVARQAVAAGAKTLQPVEDQFYGDRSGTFKDPFGHVWHIATHKEDLTPEEIRARAAERAPAGA